MALSGVPGLGNGGEGWVRGRRRVNGHGGGVWDDGLMGTKTRDVARGEIYHI